jgi:hypothetical protein
MVRVAGALGIIAVLAGVVLFVGGRGEGVPATTEAATTLPSAPAATATSSVTTTFPTTTTTEPSTTTTDLITTSSQAVPETFALESYVGIDADAAQTSLESFGLSVRRSLEGSPTVPAGRVIRHDPEAGAGVVLGDVVEIVISSGPPDVVVPDVAEVLADTAVLVLENEGFEVNSRPIASGLVGSGRAIRTNPGRGETAVAGSSIDLFVSSGPAPGCSVLFVDDRARIGLSFAVSLDDSGTPTGFDIAVTQAVIDQMCGLDVTEVYVPLTARQRFTALIGGEIDVLLTANSSRDYDLLYTTPYVLLDGTTPRGLAIRANLPSERLELNAALLELIDSGGWLKLHREWLGEPEYGIQDMLATPLPEG